MNNNFDSRQLSPGRYIATMIYIFTRDKAVAIFFLYMFEHKKPRSLRRPNQGPWRQVVLLAVLAACIYFYLRGLLSMSSVNHVEQAPEHKATKPTQQNFGSLRQQFHLKHVFHHGTGKYSRTHRRLDVTPQYLNSRMPLDSDPPVEATALDPDNLHDIYTRFDWPSSRKDKDPWTMPLGLKTATEAVRVQRLTERHTPHFLDSYFQYAIKVKGNPAKLNLINLEWEPEKPISVPDVKDKDTLVNLALMSSNAYVRLPKTDKEKKKLDWVDVGDPWDVDGENPDVNFGWLEDGLRGHVFVSNDTKNVVIAIKGTSGAGIPGGGSEETTANDKTNDNLLFLCCCARVSYLWTTVCNCYEKAYTCNQDCLESELVRQDRYYQAVLDLYRNVTKLYPPDKTEIWVTGHSLGGALASLLGRTYGLPAVAFEAPGEMLATKRLHLPQPPGLPRHMEYIWHIGNTADPIFMGVCNGVSLSCSLAGYAMESTCHTGQLCIYDVVTDLGWHVNLLNHRIHTVIDDIILAYNKTPECVPQPPCRDCFNWRFISRDDDPEEPELPNPLKPSTSGTSLMTILPTPTTSETTTEKEKPTETDTPKRCLERTWYGWCLKWGDGDDDSDGDQ